MRRLWLILLVLLIAYGLTGVAQVRPGERAVVRRPSDPAGLCVVTATPRLSITRPNTADFATGPLSR